MAVLIDNYSHSAAENMALFLKELPNVTVMGMSGDAGAGGSSETDVQLPGGYTFAFPNVGLRQAFRKTALAFQAA